MVPKHTCIALQRDCTVLRMKICLTLDLIEAPFNAFANRADPDQAALVRGLKEKMSQRPLSICLRRGAHCTDILTKIVVMSHRQSSCCLYLQ